MKRALDVILACVLTVPALLLSAPIALLIVCDSKGPVLFRQVRVGRDQQPFTLLKWRTMAADTGDRPSHEVSRDRITRIGAFLRRTKLDELPQLWNVLTGDMSFVGPRPCLPSQTELIAERERHGVNRLRPGITGISQIAGVDMSDPVRLAAMDATYLWSQGLWTDLDLMIRTALNRGAGDAVKQ